MRKDTMRQDDMHKDNSRYSAPIQPANNSIGRLWPCVPQATGATFSTDSGFSNFLQARSAAIHGADQITDVI
jgi:hypothetical protein